MSPIQSQLGSKKLSKILTYTVWRIFNYKKKKYTPIFAENFLALLIRDTRTSKIQLMFTEVISSNFSIAL